MAESGNQHCPFCSHAIIADAMGVTLKSHLDITVAQQSLYRFRIGLDADEKRCKAVTQIMEAESPQVIIDQSAFVVPVRGENGSLHCRWPEIIFHQQDLQTFADGPSSIRFVITLLVRTPDVAQTFRSAGRA
jgi:hypothetical protein